MHQVARRVVEAVASRSSGPTGALDRREARRVADRLPERRRAPRARPRGPPRSKPSASTTAFIAPALVPLISAIASRPSSSSRSSTPQVSAPCAPPPCSARLMRLRGRARLVHAPAPGAIRPRPKDSGVTGALRQGTGRLAARHRREPSTAQHRVRGTFARNAGSWMPPSPPHGLHLAQRSRSDARPRAELAERHRIANQQTLCRVMLEHPGVIAYHAEYPAEAVSEWTEIYATDAAFRAHLDNPKGKAPLGAVVARLREDHLPLLRRPGRRPPARSSRASAPPTTTPRPRPSCSTRAPTRTRPSDRDGQGDPHDGPRPRRGALHRLLRHRPSASTSPTASTSTTSRSSTCATRRPTSRSSSPSTRAAPTLTRSATATATSPSPSTTSTPSTPASPPRASRPTRSANSTATARSWPASSFSRTPTATRSRSSSATADIAEMSAALIRLAPPFRAKALRSPQYPPRSRATVQAAPSRLPPWAPGDGPRRRPDDPRDRGNSGRVSGLPLRVSFA